MNEKGIEIEKKLSKLLRDNVTFKYTKSEKRSYQQLLDFIIELEIKNNELERKIEFYKIEMFRLNQTAINSKIELDENNKKLFHNESQLKRFYDTNNHTQFVIPTVQSEKLKNNSNEISISANSDDYSIDPDLILTVRKNKNRQKKDEDELILLNEENTSMLKELNVLVNEVKSMRNTIDEKDNIITILYQEIDHYKSLSSNKICDYCRDSKIINHLQDEDLYAHLSDLEIIRTYLKEFLNYYGIDETFKLFDTNSYNNNQSINIRNHIEIRMKEIKYVLVNLKKINIIFKTLFMEFSKNLLNIFQRDYCSKINHKLENMQKKLNQITIIFSSDLNL